MWQNSWREVLFCMPHNHVRLFSSVTNKTKIAVSVFIVDGFYRHACVQNRSQDGIYVSRCYLRDNFWIKCIVFSTIKLDKYPARLILEFGKWNYFLASFSTTAAIQLQSLVIHFVPVCVPVARKALRNVTSTSYGKICVTSRVSSRNLTVTSRHLNLIATKGKNPMAITHSIPLV